MLEYTKKITNYSLGVGYFMRQRIPKQYFDLMREPRLQSYSKSNCFNWCIIFREIRTVAAVSYLVFLAASFPINVDGSRMVS
jgi:hypothetical protein